MFPILEIDPQELRLHLQNYILVDVREPHERQGPEGYIQSSLLVPLGEKLVHFLTTADPTHPYLFICRAGVRSHYACAMAQTYGFLKVYNLKGGMIAWNQHHKD